MNGKKERSTGIRMIDLNKETPKIVWQKQRKTLNCIPKAQKIIMFCSKNTEKP